MPRIARAVASGFPHHVVQRGNNREKVFLNDEDNEKYLSLLKKYSDKWDMPILAYCLMSNHVHLLIRENVEGGTSLYMRRLLTSYSRYFNVRRDRVGSLFIHPFRAVLIDGDEQLLHVSRYIHLNPYVARIVRGVHGYEWSSLGEYTSGSLKRTCHQAFINSIMSASKYQSFVEDEADYARSIADAEHLLIDFEH